MKYLVIQALCQTLNGGYKNGTTNSGNNSSFNSILHNCEPMDKLSEPLYLNVVGPKTDKEDEANAGAVMYIVAVLVFYSAGIVIMIIKYLRREKRELEEERILEDFFRTMPACKKEREQDNVNRVAIHAFHALTSFNETQFEITNVNESIVTFVDTIKEDDDGLQTMNPYVDGKQVENLKVSEMLITDV